MATPHPGLRAPAARARATDRRDQAGGRRNRGRRREGNRPARAQARGAARRDLPQPDADAARAGGPPPAAALHPRLPAHGVQRLRGAARRSPVPRRSRDRRRVGAPRRRERHGHRPPEGPRHQGKPAAQLRHGPSRGIPQGAAAVAPRGKVRRAGHHAHRHPRGLPRPRRRGARPGGSDRPQPARDGRAAHPDHRRRRRRGWVRAARWRWASPTA